MISSGDLMIALQPESGDRCARAAAMRQESQPRPTISTFDHRMAQAARGIHDAEDRAKEDNSTLGKGAPSYPSTYLNDDELRRWLVPQNVLAQLINVHLLASTLSSNGPKRQTPLRQTFIA